MFFEIPVDNLTRAGKFYATTFDWKINELPEMHYTQIGTVEADRMGVRGTPKEPGAINGGMVERGRQPTQTPIIYIKVEDIERACALVEKNGGKVIKSKAPVGDFGFAAYFEDTEGNTVGLWEFR
jgi:hypothetical protein